MQRCLALLAAVGVMLILPSVASAAAPEGVTGFAAAGRVDLAWQPAAGAQSYRVYRGATPATVATAVSGPLTGRTFSVAAAAGSTAYYAVRATVGGVESGNSRLVSATVPVRSCASANPIVDENCLSGTSDWGIARNPGIAGFSTRRSVDPGGSLDLKVDSEGAAYDAEIYRTGYYHGMGARLVSTILNVPGVSQPACASDPSGTGVVDCSAWARGESLTTTAAWPSGVYLVRIVRRDTGLGNHVLFVVRNEARRAAIVYGVPDTTYQAYNNWGGKSLYPAGSSGANTVAGDTRAVKVSFDRPYAQPTDPTFVDWYTRSDFPAVAWLERSGYDISYVSVADLETEPALPRNHRVYFSGAHDEYWSAAMRSSLEAARSTGTSLFFAGANAVYWKVRFEGGGRVMVCYKTTQGPSHLADPTGIPTGTWRDPAGINRPENALIGGFYVGDHWGVYFPIVVSAVQGRDRVWRYTGLDTRPNGAAPASIGQALVGWEWDRREANGVGPAGVKAVATSPVNGALLRDNGGSYVLGSDLSEVTRYTVPSGATVFSTGTNQWNRGLAYTAEWQPGSDPELGEPNIRIQQATTNVLSDMGARPGTPAGGIVLDRVAGAAAPGTGGAKRSTPRVKAKVHARWKRAGKRTRLKRLWVTRAPKGGRIEIRCRGKRCHAKTRRHRTAKGGKVRLTRFVNRRVFGAGATLEVRVLAWQHIGRVVRFDVKRRGRPRTRRLCLAVGARRASSCSGPLRAASTAAEPARKPASGFAGPFASTEW